MLKIDELRCTVEGKEILKGVSLQVNPGEVHAIMGPNGSGKSTLSSLLAGSEAYVVTGGSVTYKGQDLLDMDPEARACEGIFLAFQYPVEIPGVSNTYFLRQALNTQRRHRGEEPLDAMDFIQVIKDAIHQVEMDESLMKRSVNEGFSGGEKKRNEILQLLVLNPTLAILDETDSGLDIDALRTVAAGVNRYRTSDNAVLMITHYQRLLDYIKPDQVHVLLDGRLVKSGGPELALELEDKGYDWLRQEAPA